MIDLEVGILFMDKYAYRIPSFVEQIHKCYPTFKITLLNNSNQDIDVPDYCKLIKNDSGNRYTLYSRKLVVEQSTSDYIWFIDEDDDITGVDLSDVTDEFDVHEFYFNRSKKEGEIEHVWDYSQNTLWVRFIRTSILKDIYSHVTIEHKAICGEDTFVSKASKSKKYSAKVKLHEKSLYILNEYNGCSGLANYENNLDKFNRTLFGRPLICELRDKYYPDIDDDFGLYFYILKIYESSNKESIKEMYRIIQETGGATVDDIAEVWRFAVFGNNLINDYNLQRDIIKETFPDDLDLFAIRNFKWDEKTVISPSGKEVIVSYNERYEYINLLDANPKGS